MKFTQIGKQDGLHLIRFEDGVESRVTDEELHALKTGLPKTEREALRAAAAENKQLRRDIEDARKQLEEAVSERNVAATKHEELTKRFSEVETSAKEWKEKYHEIRKELNASKSNKAVTKPPENKAVAAAAAENK